MDALTSLFKDFDFAAMLPELDTFIGQLRFWAGLIMVLGPLVMLCAGLLYTFRPSPNPQCHIGFRSYLSTGSTDVWRFSQRLAGTVYTVLGGALFVVFLLLSFFFGLMNPLTMATVALICIILFFLLALAANVLIRKRILHFYDKEGTRLK